MARPLRIQYPGAFYHVTCRGNNRQEIFIDDSDRRKFNKILIRSLSVFSVKLHAFVFMENHFHLLVETPLGNLAEFMRQFNIAYTGYYNRRHKRMGHLFQGRYKSLLVEKNEYLAVLSRYIHLNPVRIKSYEKTPIETKMDFLGHYPWSSLPGYLDYQKREEFIDYNLVLADYGGGIFRGRKAYARALYTDLANGLKIDDKIIGQCIFGGSEFLDWITEKFLKGEKDRERPALKKINTFRSKEVIIKAIKEQTGKDIETVIKEKGVHRQMAMELLYRLGGLTGKEIGRIMGVGYTSVSQERRRLAERLENDQKLKRLINVIEQICQ
jgi:putative transposase